jgi:cytidylate kinase-like protein
MARRTHVVCVSHLTGAEGEAVARGVANRLDFRYLDEEIIETAAEWAGLDSSVVGEVERRKSLVRRIGEAIRSDPMPTRPDAAEQRGRGTALPRERPSDEDLRALIRDVIRETAEEGNIVIASHAAAMVLAHREDILRVLVTASPKTRASRIANEENVDPRPAEKLVADADASRADYLKRFHDIDRELPVHYDLVVNTDDLSPELGADLVALVAKQT